MLEFVGNFVYVSRSLSCCIGRKLLNRRRLGRQPGLVPGEFTVYKKGPAGLRQTHEFNENII